MATVLIQEAAQLLRSLQPRHIAVQVQEVDAVQLQGDVVSE
jgi:hypothetical protein